jgi:hypothetical protein
MPSNGFRAGLDRARRARHLASPAPPATPTTTPPAPKAEGKPDRPPKPPVPTVRHCCGHTQPVAGITTRPCPRCLKEGRRKRAKKIASDAGRLPDGATFRVSYDAPTKTWSGTLEVKVPGAPSRSFQGSARAVFRLLADLDQQYRQEATVAAGDKTGGAP